MPNGRRAPRKQAGTTQPAIERVPPRPQAVPHAPVPPPLRIVTAHEVTAWLYACPASLPDMSVVEALSTFATSAVLANESAARDVLISWGARKDPLPTLCGPPHGPLGLPGDYVLVRWIVRQQPLVHLGLFHNRDPRLSRLRSKLTDKAREGFRLVTHPPVGLGAFAAVAVRMARFWIRIGSECRVPPN